MDWLSKNHRGGCGNLAATPVESIGMFLRMTVSNFHTRLWISGADGARQLQPKNNGTGRLARGPEMPPEIGDYFSEMLMVST